MPKPAAPLPLDLIPLLRMSDLLRLSTRSNAEAPEQSMLRSEHRLLLHRALLRLSASEERVIRLLYGIGCPERSMEDIALSLGVTRHRIDQIRLRALKKLRERKQTLEGVRP